MTVIFKTLLYSKATMSELFNMETSISVLNFFDKIEVHQPSHMRTTRTLKALDARNTSFSFSKVLVSAVVWNAANINHSNAFFNIVDKKICIECLGSLFRGFQEGEWAGVNL